MDFLHCLEREKRELEQNEELQKHGACAGCLIALEFDSGHIHIHYPEAQIAQNILSVMMKDKYVEPVREKDKQKEMSIDDKNRKIVFGHHRALGDALMFSAGIRDFKLLFPEIKINVDSNQPMIWENNPYLDRSLTRDQEDVEYYKVGYPMVSNANNTAMHFTVMFLFDMIANVDLHHPLGLSVGEFCSIFANGSVGDPSLGDPNKNSASKEPFIGLRNKYRNICRDFVRQRGDVHLSDKEKKKNLIKDAYGVDKYWVIAPGGKRDCTSKIWDWRKFQKVIDHFDGLIKFVVIGRSDHLIEPLNNVINLVDKFNPPDVRDLVPLVYHAEGCVSGPSFLMHLAAAVPPKFSNERKPCVSILGGREPSAWTWYCNHQVLHTNGIFTCCSNGGCWTARVHPLPKDPKHNKNLCKRTRIVDDRTVAACMDLITEHDVIRAIERYYEGDIYTLKSKNVVQKQKSTVIECYPVEESEKDVKEQEPLKIKDVKVSLKENNNRLNDVEKTTGDKCTDDVLKTSSMKQINLLGNLNTDGGGEQSLMMIAKVLADADWQVNVHPWGSINKKFKDNKLVRHYDFKSGAMLENMVTNIPLLFYANDCVWDFPKTAQDIVGKSSSLIVGINYMLGNFKNYKHTEWLDKSGKLKAIILQNQEKKDEWDTQVIGFDKAKKIVLYGAVDVNRFYEVCPPERDEKEPLVVLKHCKPDYRKYVTEESSGSGQKIHIWQKNLAKDKDVKLYSRLIKNMGDTVRFEFMEAHPELVNEFKDHKQFKFFKWDEISVEEFLARGHVYLYRTSNAWRDNYPRVVAEALISGLPVLTEPRDGTKDRVQHGDTGFYCVDYDGYLYALKLLYRKEKYRQQMGIYAKDWAKANLDPKKWVSVIEDVL